jgi:hypothetical protein
VAAITRSPSLAFVLVMSASSGGSPLSEPS